MSVEAGIDILLAVVALSAIGGGIAVAVSPAWASVVVGGIVLGIIVVSRLRPGGKRE